MAMVGIFVFLFVGLAPGDQAVMIAARSDGRLHPRAIKIG